MNRVAKFSKVSFDQFYNDYCGTFFDDCDKPSKESVREIYDQIKIPTRATKGSAGYDFFAPFDMSLTPGVEMKVPTGIRVEIDNAVGVIDSDYFHSDNEGHIFAKVINDSRQNKKLFVKTGSSFVQGILLPYGISYDDEADGVRNGGFGSTSIPDIVEFGAKN